MSINLINLAGPILGKPNYQAAGSKTKSGKTVPFARLSFKFGLPDDSVVLGGQKYPLSGQNVWVSVDVPQDKERRVKEGEVNAFIAAVERGQAYCVITEGKLTSWQPKDGSPAKYELKCSLRNVRLSGQQLKSSNFAVIAGTFQGQAQGWAHIEERYNVQGEWRSRVIPVLVGGDLLTSQGAQVLVYGRLASTMWDGTPFLHVIAEEVL